MTDNAPEYSISVLEDRREIHFSIAGFFMLDEIHKFLNDLDKHAYPIAKDRQPFSAIGDMSAAAPQGQAASDAIRDHLIASRKAGLTRIAVISDAPLVRSQYRRLSEGLEVEFFDTKAEGLEWLRGTGR